MKGRLQTRAIWLQVVERLTMAIAAPRGLLGGWTVVMTPVAGSALFSVEIRGSRIVGHAFHQGEHNLAVRHFGRLVPVAQLLYHDLFRNVVNGIDARVSVSALEYGLGNAGFLFRSKLRGFIRPLSGRQETFGQRRMALPAGSVVKPARFIHVVVAACAAQRCLLFGMTALATLLARSKVHRLFEPYEPPSFDPERVWHFRHESIDA